MANFVKHIGSYATKTAANTLVWAWPSSSTAGNLIVCTLVFDNAATASRPVVTGISRPAGETATWVFLGASRSTSTSAGAFSSAEMWAIKTTVNWTTPTITATFDASVTMRSMLFSEFANTEITLRNTVGSAYSTTTTAASAATTGTTPQVGDLAIGVIFQSNSSTVPTGDNDTTGGSWSAVQGVGSTGSSGTTNNMGSFQYKVLTAANHQTLNNQAALTAGNGAIVAILTPTPLAKVETFTDDFATQIDPTKWTRKDAGVTWEAGRAKLETIQTVYPTMRTDAKYDFTNSSLFAKMTNVAIPARGREFQFGVRPTAVSDDAVLVLLYFDVAPSLSPNLLLRVRQSSVNTDSGWQSYDPVAHAYLRLRMSGTTVYLDGSPDGITWTQLTSGTTSLNLSSCAIDVEAGQWQDEGGTSFGYIDSINIPGSVWVPPKTETLVDAFDTKIDRGKWSSTSAAVVWDAGRAKLPVTTAYNSLGTYNSGTLDFTESSVTAKIIPSTGGNGGRESFLQIMRGGVTNDKLTIFVSGANINARRTVGGVDTYGPGATYNATSHAWWRMREVGGRTYFDTSPDGITWTHFWSVANGFAVTKVWINITSGYYGTEAASDTYVDHVNVSRPKEWTGSTMALKPVTTWSGTAQIEKPWKVWDGIRWRLLSQPATLNLFAESDGLVTTDQATDGTTYCFGTEFYVTKTAYVTKVRYLHPTIGNLTQRTMALYSTTDGNTGTKVGGDWVMPTPVAGKWCTLTLSSPITLVANTRYRIVTLHPAGTGFARTYNYFTTGGAGDSQITIGGYLVRPAQFSALNTAQGSYVPSATMAFPNQIYQYAGYYSDVGVTDIQPLPVAGFSVSSNLQIGIPVTFTSTSSAATTWVWNFGADATPATANTIGPHAVTYSAIGSKTVILDVTNSTGSDSEVQTVTVGAGPTTDVFDDFNRVAANLAAMGNGWNNEGTGASASTDGANIQYRMSGYGRVGTTFGVTLPVNYAVEVVAPNTTWSQAWVGIFGRYYTGDSTGVKLFSDGANWMIGNAYAYNYDNANLTMTNGFPGGWTAAGDHTMRLEIVGTRADVYADGQHVGYRDNLGTWCNSARTGSQAGFCGDSYGTDRPFRSIRVYSL